MTAVFARALRRGTASAPAVALIFALAVCASAEQKTMKEGSTMYDSPKGAQVGRVAAGAPVHEVKIQGDRTLVVVEGWAPKSSFTKIPKLLARVKTLTPASDNTEIALKAGGGKSVGKIDRKAAVEMKDISGAWVKVVFSGWISAGAVGAVDAAKPESKPEKKEEAPAQKLEETPATDEKPAPEAVVAVPPVVLAAESTRPRVRIATNMGDIVVELAPDKAPKSVENFLAYVRKGHYDGTIFHRVISNFMIQGGGFDESYNQKPTDPAIPIESQNGLKNVRGSIAMARTSDPNSATAQFFINVVDNANLDYPNPDGHGYAVFGSVISGMDVADKIRQIPTGRGGPLPRDVPKTMVVISKATIEQ